MRNIQRQSRLNGDSVIKQCDYARRSDANPVIKLNTSA
jgi:hypothetical protein